jgi:hypothetical protein
MMDFGGLTLLSVLNCHRFDYSEFSFLSPLRLPASLTGKFEFLEQMNREIDSMVLAWRHKVDHAANHLAILPSTDFMPDVAEHIMSAVRIYMLRLMEGMPATV